MRAADIVGRKVVSVEQKRVYDKQRGGATSLESITFDNGTCIVTSVRDTENSPIVTVRAYKQSKQSKTKRNKFKKSVASTINGINARADK